MILQNVFLGRQFVLDLPWSFTYKEKKLLKDKITAHNGIVSYIVTRKSDYVIRCSNENAPTYRTGIAEKYGIPIVTAEFVDACLKNGSLVDCKLFAAFSVDKQNVNQFAKGKIIMQPETKQKSQNTKLFQVKTWPYKDVKGPNFHNDPYVVIKASVLKGREKQGRYPFCIIEIHACHTNLNLEEHHYQFCVFVHQGFVPVPSDKLEYGTKICRFVHSPSEALRVFEQLLKLYLNPPHSMSLCTKFPSHPGLGSDFFHIQDWVTTPVLMLPAVAQIVKDIWTDASLKLETTLCVPFKDIHPNQLVKAGGLLLEISKVIFSPDRSQLDELTKEFEVAIPHRSAIIFENNTSISRKYNLCQLIRDMQVLSDSLSLYDGNKVEQQYHSMHCSIQPLDKHTTEYHKISGLATYTKDDTLQVSISTIFRIHRYSEDEGFTYNVGNKKLLLYGSHSDNFIGLLSRGLIPPKMKTTTHTDIARYTKDFGNRLLFYNDVSAIISDSTATNGGKRLLLVNEVALGECYDVFSFDKHLTPPPEGYHSVRGVKRHDPDIMSEYEHDQFVVYNDKQQRIKYLVEFTISGDPDKDTSQTIDPGILNTDPWKSLTEVSIAREEDEPISAFDLQDFLFNCKRDRNAVKAGLLSHSNVPVPLKSVHVRAKLVDLAAEVVIMQEYCNTTSTSIDARYVLPLDDKAAVCGFEAFSNGQHFIGRIEVKQQAQKEYKSAVDSGRQAYLMDEELPNVFKVSVGNIKPHSTVLVKIRYVTELELERELISFILPGAVSPLQQQEVLSSHVHAETADASQCPSINSSVEIFVDMPFDIKSLTSSTHQIKSKKTASHAVVNVDVNTNLTNGFQLLIGLSEIHVPRMWVENHPKLNSTACMLAFYPEFVSDTKEDVEVILALDASNSMAGLAFETAQQVAILCLHYLSMETKFNVILFGTTYRELFPNSKPKSFEDAYDAEQFILRSHPTFGSSKVNHFLKSYFYLKPEKGTLRNIFIITDGHLQQTDPILRKASVNRCHTRIFSLGVGPLVNNHLLKQLSQAAGGAYEYFDSNIKSKWAMRAQDQVMKAEEPVLTDVTVEWQQFDNDDDDVLQAPQQIAAVFNGSRVTVYGFVPNCSLATLTGYIKGNKVSTTVFTSELCKCTGTTLHCLTTRAVVRDWDSGVLNEDLQLQEVLKRALKSKIIGLSKEFGIVTPLTSFIAVEDNDDTEINMFGKQPTIEEFVQAEDVDFLQYLQFRLVLPVADVDEKDLSQPVVPKTAMFGAIPPLPSPPIAGPPPPPPKCGALPLSLPKFGAPPPPRTKFGAPPPPVRLLKSAKSIVQVPVLLQINTIEQPLPLPPKLKSTTPRPPTATKLATSHALPPQVHFSVTDEVDSSNPQNYQRSRFLTRGSAPNLGQPKMKRLHGPNTFREVTFRAGPVMAAASKNPPSEDGKTTSVQKSSPKALHHELLDFLGADDAICEKESVPFCHIAFGNFLSAPVAAPSVYNDYSDSVDGKCLTKLESSDRGSGLSVHDTTPEKKSKLPRRRDLASLPRASVQSLQDFTDHVPCVMPHKRRTGGSSSGKQTVETTTSMGNGLPFISSIYRELARTFPELGDKHTIHPELHPEKQSASSIVHCTALESTQCSINGSCIELNNLPAGWNHQLWNDIQTMLVTQGLKSMGRAAQDAILRFVGTMALLFVIFHQKCPVIFPLDLTSIDIMKKQARKMAETLSPIGCALSFDGMRVVQLLGYLITVNQRYPLVYRTLELGNSWEEALHKLTGGQNIITYDCVHDFLSTEL